MTKEKLVSLNKYLSDLKSRLAEAQVSVPAKHKHRSQQYKELLQREIFKTQLSIAEANK